MDIGLIATDLDGTLLRSDKTLSSFTTDTLRLCKARGIRLTFVTARSEAACKSYAETLAPDIIVSCGGARLGISKDSL
jgi:hydroxymethylpyrimidine pyrophosphatase-like HAD family hydrolase